MTRAGRLLLFIPAVIAATLWFRSYVRFDIVTARQCMVSSESGTLYFYDGVGQSPQYLSGPAGHAGRLESQFGAAYRPWLPLRTWRYNADRIVAIEWWALTAGCGLPAWWTVRHLQRTRTRGFEVREPPAEVHRPAATDR